MKLKLRRLTFTFAIILAVFGFFIFTDNASAANVNQTGTYTSDVKSTGVATWSTMTWGLTNEGANTTIKVRSCDNGDSTCSAATAWASCTAYAIGDSGSDISANNCVTDGDEYIQYQIIFNEDYDDTVSGSLITLDSVVINYSQYTSGASTLTSSKYYTSDGNVMAGVEWIEDTTLPSGTAIGLYLRTAATEVGLTGDFFHVASSTAPSTQTTGCTKTAIASTASSTVSCLNLNNDNIIDASMEDSVDDEWFQYMVILDSDGANTPTLGSNDPTKNDLRIVYVVNASPDFDTSYGTNGVSASQDTSTGLVNIAFSVRDEDTTTGANAGFITPSYYYSINAIN